MGRARDGALSASIVLGTWVDNEPRDEDVESIVDHPVGLGRMIYTDPDITLRAPPAGVPVVGDAARLPQVLRNLVGNAVQHNPAGTAVRLVLRQDHDRVRADVTDDGTGIAAADVPRPFDRFWRAEASRSRDYGGSGLGLAIVRAHDGRVTVHSELGHGTTVSLHLPAAPDHSAGHRGSVLDQAADRDRSDVAGRREPPRQRQPDVDQR
jgi:two-component system OmpR family sensor kinase